MGSRDDDRRPPESEGRDNQELDPPHGDSAPQTESVEQYMWLHEHIERLRADMRPDAPALATPEEAHMYRMAALFRAAAPGAAEPNPAFVSTLRARLEREQAPATDPAASAPPAAPPRQQLSRRGLIGAGLGAAAAALVGAAVGNALERGQSGSMTEVAQNVPLVPSGSGTWVAVADAGAIPVGGVVRFVTDAIIGFVRHTPQGFVAVSGVCTHMSCLLSWNQTDRTFDCPCHGGRFTEAGVSAPSSPVRYSPLPAIETKVEGGKVWVYVVPPANGQHPTVPPRYGKYSSSG